MSNEKTAFESHSSPLLIADPDTLEIVDVNEQLTRQFSVNESELFGSKYSEFLPGHTVDEINEFVKNDTLPLMSVDETRFMVGDASEEGERIKLNVYRWESRDGQIILQLEQLNKSFTGRFVEREVGNADKLQLFNHLLYHFPDTIYFKDRQSRFLMINFKQAEILGVDKPEDAVGKTDFDFFPRQEAERAYEDEQKIIKSGEPVINKQERVTSSNGKKYWVSTTKVPLTNNEGEVIGTMGITRDINKQKQLEDENKELLDKERMLREQIEESYQELEIQKKRFQGAFEKAAIGMALVSTEGQFLRVNDSLCEMLSYAEEELKSMKFQDITHPDDLDKDLSQLEQLLNGEIDYYTMEKRYFDKQGDIIWTILNVSLVRDNAGDPVHFVSQVQDITERKEYEQKMDQSLEEKQVLLEEIHHRVKNNLASVSGILELQTYSIEDEKIKQVLKDAQSRIYTMALVHEQLYQHDSLSNIKLGNFAEQLIETINNSLNTEDKNLQTHVDAEDVTLEVTKAVPCGLILNELITNAYKHGFKGRDEGNIWVKIREQEDQVRVDIDDDGVGLPDDFSLDNQDTLGINLINTLISQLEADFDYDSNGNGAHFQIKFAV